MTRGRSTCPCCRGEGLVEALARRPSCEIALRLYDPALGRVRVYRFLKPTGGPPTLCELRVEQPTPGDRRFLEALERGGAEFVDADGVAVRP